MDKDWFERGFGNAIAEVRHELLGGWFGRSFEPHPLRQHGLDRSEPNPDERDIHGNERDR